MKNINLAEDYIIRAGNRLEAIRVLIKRNSYADVVRESQEVVELSLKALLRHANIEVPRLHDVSDVLNQESAQLPQEISTQLNRITKVSKQLRRDRELAFYGAEDLTPSQFYQQDDARQAFEDAKWVHELCRQAMGRHLET